MAIDEISAKVQRMLVGTFNDVRLTKDGGFSLPMGSTTVYVEVKAWAPDSEGNPRTLVYLWSPLAREVPISPELFEWAATEGRKHWFGGVVVAKNEDGKTAFVTYDHSLLGNTLDPAELSTATNSVGWTADELDDVVTSKFGGKRWSDS